MDPEHWLVYGMIFAVAFSEAFVISNAFTFGGPALVASGVSAGTGKLSFFVALLAAWIGTFSGAAISFAVADWACRTPFLARSLRRLQVQQARLANRPFLIILAAHFVPGVGSAAFVLMAALLTWRIFCAMEALAALVSATAHLSLGYALASLPFVQALLAS